MSKSLEDEFEKIIAGFLELFTDIIATANKNGYTTLNSEMLKIGNMMLNKKIKELGNTAVMNSFIKRTHTHWVNVAEQDEKHFAKCLPDLLVPTGIPKNYVEEFCKLFIGTTKSGKDYLPKEDKEAFFDNAIELIKISLKYIYKNRLPIKKDGKTTYTKNFFGDISLSKNAELFKITL